MPSPRVITHRICHRDRDHRHTSHTPPPDGRESTLSQRPRADQPADGPAARTSTALVGLALAPLTRYPPPTMHRPPLALLLLALLATLLLAAPALAAPLTPAEAVRIAVERDPGLRAAGLRIREQRAAVTAAEGAFDLQITGRLDYNTSRRTLTVEEPTVDGDVVTLRRRFDTRQGAFDIGLLQPLVWGTRVSLDFANDFTATDNPFQNCIPGLTSSECYETQLRLTLTQPLLRGFGQDVNTAAIETAEAQVDAARLQQRETAEALIATVVSAWAELAYAAQAVEIRAQALTLAREQLAATEAQIEVGRLAPADRPVVAQAVARRTRELAVAELALADRQATLAVWLDREDVSAAPFGEAEAFALTLDAAASAAEAENPTIALRAIERRQLETSLRVQEDSGRPRLDLSLVAAQAGISDRYGEALASLPDNDTHFYGASLEFAWAPANNAAEGESARVRFALRALEAELQSLRESVRIEVGEAVRAALAADTTVKLDTEVAALAADAVEAERLKFESGRATNLDVLQVQQDLAEARLTVARAEADRLIARVRVQQLTGGLLDAYGLQLAEP